MCSLGRLVSPVVEPSPWKNYLELARGIYILTNVLLIDIPINLASNFAIGVVINCRSKAVAFDLWLFQLLRNDASSNTDIGQTYKFWYMKRNVHLCERVGSLYFHAGTVWYVSVTCIYDSFIVSYKSVAYWPCTFLHCIIWKNGHTVEITRGVLMTSRFKQWTETKGEEPLLSWTIPHGSITVKMWQRKCTQHEPLHPSYR